MLDGGLKKRRRTTTGSTAVSLTSFDTPLLIHALHIDSSAFVTFLAKVSVDPECDYSIPDSENEQDIASSVANPRLGSRGSACHACHGRGT